MNCKIVQINLNHCWAPHDVLKQFLKEKEIDIAMVTEPIYIPGENWFCSLNKSAAIHWTAKLKARIQEVFKEEDFVAIEVCDTVLISCYVPPTKSLIEFSRI